MKSKLKNSRSILRRIETLLEFLKSNDLIRQGELCGMANGLRLLKAEITGEEPLFERGETLRKIEGEVFFHWTEERFTIMKSQPRKIRQVIKEEIKKYSFKK
jgi:hypothetical protein